MLCMSLIHKTCSSVVSRPEKGLPFGAQSSAHSPSWQGGSAKDPGSQADILRPTRQPFSGSPQNFCPSLQNLLKPEDSQPILRAKQVNDGPNAVSGKGCNGACSLHLWIVLVFTSHFWALLDVCGGLCGTSAGSNAPSDSRSRVSLKRSKLGPSPRSGYIRARHWQADRRLLVLQLSPGWD